MFDAAVVRAASFVRYNHVCACSFTYRESVCCLVTRVEILVARCYALVTLDFSHLSTGYTFSQAVRNGCSSDLLQILYDWHAGHRVRRTQNLHFMLTCPAKRDSSVSTTGQNEADGNSSAVGGKVHLKRHVCRHGRT